MNVLMPCLPCTRPVRLLQLGLLAIGANCHAQAGTETTSLEEITVFAPPEAEWLNFQPATGSGLKLAAPLNRTPQAISIIDSNLMRAQGSVTLVDSLRYTPGVIGQYGDTDVRADWLLIRGYAPYKYLDDMRLPYGMGYGDSRIDSYFLERIEVPKGVSSSLYGAGPGTGQINMYSKLPVKNQRNEAAMVLGNHRLAQAQWDLGGANGDKTLLWRLVGEGQKDGSQIDYIRERRLTLAPSITLQPRSDLSITVNALYRSNHAPNGGAGTPWLPPEGTVLPNPHGRIETSRFLGEPGYDNFRGDTRHVGYAIKYDFNPQWALRHRLRYANTDNRFQSVNQDFMGFKPDMRTVGRSISRMAEDTTAWTSDTQLSGKFSTGVLQHHVSMGLDWRREETQFDRWRGGKVADLDVFNPEYGKPFVEPTRKSSTELRSRQTGLYAQDQIQYGPLLATLGARYDQLESVSGSDKQRDHAVSGRAALSWLFDSGVTPYISYAKGFEPVTGVDRNGGLFKPTRNEQFEIGAHYTPEQNNARLSASVFQIRQKNRLTVDTNQIESPYCGLLCQVQQGEVSLKGVELEAFAELTERLNATASYSYTHAEVTRSNNPQEIGAKVANVPRQQAALWLSYAMKQYAPGLTLYGGARYVGERQWEDRPGEMLPAVTLFDMGLRYELGNLSSELSGMTFSLNVKNVGNKRHVMGCYGSTVCYYGNERSVSARLAYQW